MPYTKGRLRFGGNPFPSGMLKKPNKQTDEHEKKNRNEGLLVLLVHTMDL